MRNRLRRLSAAAAVLLSTVLPAVAQETAEASAADLAIAAWERARSGTAAARAAAIGRLGRVDDERVTAVLLAELEAAGNDGFAVHVLDAIGQKPRPATMPALRAVLVDDGAPRNLRTAAARALGRQGSRGIDDLISLAEGGDRVPTDVRAACCDGLAAAGDDRAWRGLAGLCLKGGDVERQRALRLLDGAPGISAVTQVRIRLLGDSDLLIAAIAWRQLAEAGHERARWALDDLLERVGAQPGVAVRAELVAGMAHVLEPEHHARFLTLAASSVTAVRQRLRAAAEDLGRNEPFVTWLIASALESDVAAEREVAMLILKAAPTAALRTLVDRVRQQLRRPDRQTLELAIGLHELLAKDPTWRGDVLLLTDSRDAAVRTVGLALLLEMECGDAVAAAQRSLGDRSWELRSIAYRYLTRFRELASIPLLLARTDREHGRLDGELADALFVHTGVRCWSRNEWLAWWRKHKDGHVLPAWESVRTAASSGGGATVAYYGIPLNSHRVTFLIDVSGSMNARIGTDRKRTRLDEAKRQMHLVLEKMSSEFDFNVIFYQSSLEPGWDELRKADGRNKKEMLEKVDAQRARGGTNIYGALELAFRDPEVDTVYLLSDGQPSAGEITDADDIADQIRRWNYQRQVVVHGISVGTKSKLLERLAAESGGRFVHVR